MNIIYDIKKNKTIKKVEDFKDLKFNEVLKDRLTVKNIEYLHFKSSTLFSDMIEIEKSDITKKEYDIFLYMKDNYIGNILSSDIKFIKSEVHIN